MSWSVALHPEFDAEFQALAIEIQDELLGRLQLLAQFGPALGRPNVDTLSGSDFPNMKELRFRLDGLWRFAFAFDPQRRAIVLYGGNKEGAKQKVFNDTMIRVADRRFAAHVGAMSSSVEKRKS